MKFKNEVGPVADEDPIGCVHLLLNFVVFLEKGRDMDDTAVTDQIDAAVAHDAGREDVDVELCVVVVDDGVTSIVAALFRRVSNFGEKSMICKLGARAAVVQ